MNSCLSFGGLRVDAQSRFVYVSRDRPRSVDRFVVIASVPWAKHLQLCNEPFSAGNLLC